LIQYRDYVVPVDSLKYAILQNFSHITSESSVQKESLERLIY